MSLVIKRVALDFLWLLGMEWQGFVNPFDACKVPCDACRLGFSDYADLLTKEWFGEGFDPEEYGAKPLTSNSPGVVEYVRKMMVEVPNLNRLVEQDRIYRHRKGHWSCHLIQDDVDALVREGRLQQVGGDEPLCAETVNNWNISGMGHDAINRHICIENRCKREGELYLCPKCAGSCDLPANNYDAEGHSA